jgi:hypothetical protein
MHKPFVSPQVSEHDISGLEAMLAGTLCLMSAYAHCPCGKNQALMALKIVSNLKCLQCQNALSSEFRVVLGKVTDSWQQHCLLQSPESPAQPNHGATELWHAQPATVQ